MGWFQKLRGSFGSEQDSVAPAPAPASSPEELFKAEMAARATKLDGVTRVTQNQDDFGLLVWREDSDSPVKVYLGNLFHETRELEPVRRAQACDRFLASLVDEEEIPSDWDEARGRVLPVIRTELFGVFRDGPEVPGSVSTNATAWSRAARAATSRP